MIHDSEAAAVFGHLDALLDDLAPEPAYRQLFDTALRLVRETAEATDVFLPIDLPLAVADILGRPVHERHLAAAASTCLWAGADLMDDAADGQLPEVWSEVSPHLLLLVSTNLLSTIPHLLAARLAGRDSSAAYGEAVSRTLFVMSSGQASDLRAHRDVRTIDAYLSMVRRKSGVEFGLFAATPALLAEGDGDAAAAWVRFGMAYGTMCQVFDDTVSAIVEGSRNDLLRGKPSLPVLRALEATGDQDHLRLLADLDSAASGDQAAVQRVIDCITRTASLRFSFERIELLRYRAAQALPVKLAALEPDHAMRQLLRQFSMF